MALSKNSLSRMRAPYVYIPSLLSTRGYPMSYVKRQMHRDRKTLPALTLDKETSLAQREIAQHQYFVKHGSRWVIEWQKDRPLVYDMEAGNTVGHIAEPRPVISRDVDTALTITKLEHFTSKHGMVTALGKGVLGNGTLVSLAILPPHAEHLTEGEHRVVGTLRQGTHGLHFSVKEIKG